MGFATRLALASALAFALAADATSGARPFNPSFLVSVKSTYVDHHVTQLVYAKNVSTGCRWRYDLEATQTIDVSTTKPVVRTLSQLARGGNNFVRMAAVEQRKGSSRTGWEEGCPALKNEPATFEDVSGCGQRSYSVGITSVGDLAKSDRFAFSYRRSGPDAFNGRCFPELWVDDTSSSANPTSTVDFPQPDNWGVSPDKRPFWVALARSRLTSGKTVVLRWQDAAKHAGPYLEPNDPALYEQDTDSDEYTVSWQVTLVPLKPHR